MEEVKVSGFDLEETLKRNALAVNQKPMHQQDQARTWRRWELDQAGMDLIADGEARRRVARTMSPINAHSHKDITVRLREAHRRHG